MAFGMEITTPAPRPTPRVWATALTTYPRLEGPEYEADASGVKRWLNGVQFIPFGCERSIGTVFNPCVERLTDYQEMGACVAFHPFLVEVAVKGPTRSSSMEQLQAYVSAHSEISRSSHMAAQVERSAYEAANPSLASEAQIITNTDQSLLGAIYAVEEGLADLLDGGAGMIHLSAALFTLLQAGGGLRFDADGRAFTPTGHLVVADAGHLGVSPTTNAVVAGESWIYGSGPVFGLYDDEMRFVGTDYEHFDFSHNMIHVNAEQFGIAIFEPCSVVAAVVDINDGSIVN